MHDLRWKICNLGFILGAGTAMSCNGLPVPRPVVDGNGGDGRLQAIGQGARGAEPLPRAADGQGKLEERKRNYQDIAA